MTRRELAALLPVLTLGPRPASAQTRYVDGVFAHDGERPIELLAYASRAASGVMRLAAASFEDIPTLRVVRGVLCSQPHWKPTAVWVSTKAVFDNEGVERHQLKFGVRQLNIYAVDLSIPDLQHEDGVASVARRVRASEANPPMVFVTMQSDGMTRDYMIQLTVER
jgi:hypothetical protein